MISTVQSMLQKFKQNVFSSFVHQKLAHYIATYIVIIVMYICTGHWICDNAVCSVC